MPAFHHRAAALLLIAGLAAVPPTLAQPVGDIASPTNAPTGPPPSPGPVLPDDASITLDRLASELREARARLIDESSDEETRRTALEDAIGIAASIAQLLEEHQGNDPVVRWRNAQGEPVPWHAITTARAQRDDLLALRTLDAERLGAWAEQARRREDASRRRTQGQLVDARNILRALLIEQPEKVGLDESRIELIEIERDLALLQQNLSEPLDAEARFRSVATKYEQRLGAEHPTALDALNTHALALNALGEAIAAQEIFVRVHEARAHVLGEAHPATLVALLNSGYAYISRGRNQEALERFDRAYIGLRDTLGEADPTTLIASEARGVALQRLDRLEEALEMYLGVEAGRRATLGAEDLETLRAAANVGAALDRLDRLGEAAFRLNVVAEGRRRQLGEGHPLYLLALGELADVLIRQGQLGRAESLASRARSGWRVTLGDQHPEHIKAVERLGRIRLGQGRADEASAILTTARTLREQGGNTESDAARLAEIDLARAALASGQTQRAIEQLERTRQELAAQPGASHALTMEASRALIGAYLHVGDGRAHDAAATLVSDNPNPSIEDEAQLAIASRIPEALREAHDRAAELLGGSSTTTIALAHALALVETDRTRSIELLSEALENALAIRPVRDATRPSADVLTIAGDLARLLIEEDRAGEAFDLVQRARAHDAFDRATRSASDRVLLRASFEDNALRTEYERLLEAESVARSVAREAELRADELRERADGSLQAARAGLVAATSALLSHVAANTPTLDPMTHRELASRLGARRAHLDIVTTPRAILAMWVTPEGVRGRVVTDDPERIEAIQLAADRVRTWTLSPDSADPRNMGELTTLRLGLIPTEARRQLGESIASCSFAITERFAHVPMSLLLPDTALARVATPASAMHQIPSATPPSTLVLTASDDKDATIDALEEFTADPLRLLNASTSDPDALRTTIASTSPTTLHLALPVWVDAPTSGTLLDEYAAAPTAFDLLDALGPSARATQLVVMPASGAYSLDAPEPRHDTLGPTLALGGVRTTLYRVWAGDDDADALLTARFYANLRGHNAPDSTAPGPALLEAQRWLQSLTRARIDDAIASGDFVAIATDTDPRADDAVGERPFAHPYFWSNFVLSGAPWAD